MRLIASIAAAIVAVSIPAAAESPVRQAPIFERLEGAWSANGKAFGQPTQSTMRWSRAVGDKWWRLEYSIDYGRAGAPRFDGVAYYKSTDQGRHVGTWVDSNADLHPIEATDDGTALTSLWGVPGRKYGKSEYRLTAEGVEVTDWIQADGAWRQFNQTRFTRAAG